MNKIIIAVTGASGSIYAKRIFHHLSNFKNLEIGVVFSKNAKDVWQYELQEEIQIPYKIYDKNDFMAPFASGSAKYTSMIIIPCSMGTLARIANGFSDDLITRSADVILKERRKLVCVVRETPYNLIHLKNMVQITEAGGIILPATPSFYALPKTIEEVCDSVVLRALESIGLDTKSYQWGE